MLSPNRLSTQKILLVLSLVVVVLAGTLSIASHADAAAYTKAVYAPKKVNATTMEAWADLSRDCSGTFGCSNYIKIERKRWYGVDFVNGWWANANGWNSISATLPSGCGTYRTTVDSYNDTTGSYGSGVNTGPVGGSSNGTKIYRFRVTWSSGWVDICR